MQPFENPAAQGALPDDLVGRVEQVIDGGDALIGLAGVQELDTVLIVWDMGGFPSLASRHRRLPMKIK